MHKNQKILFGPTISKKFLPTLPSTTISLTNNFQELMQNALNKNFDCVVTQLHYEKKALGLELLEKTKNIHMKKIVCTDRNKGVKNLVENLNGIILHENELPTLNALAFSDAPLKKEGKILLNVPSYQALWLLSKELQKNIIEKIFPDLVVNTYSENELLTELHLNRFKLIIDISTATYFKESEKNIIENLFHEFRFFEIPRLIILKDKLTLINNIYKILKNEQTSKA